MKIVSRFAKTKKQIGQGRRFFVWFSLNCFNRRSVIFSSGEKKINKRNSGQELFMINWFVVNRIFFFWGNAMHHATTSTKSSLDYTPIQQRKKKLSSIPRDQLLNKHTSLCSTGDRLRAREVKTIFHCIETFQHWTLYTHTHERNAAKKNRKMGHDKSTMNSNK